jgi:hypothetical protein
VALPLSSGNGLDANRNTELFGHKLSKRCANALSNFYIAGEDRNSAIFADMHPRTAAKAWTRNGHLGRGKKRAVIAVARKLAVLLHRLWVSGDVYIPLRLGNRVTLPAVA